VWDAGSKNLYPALGIAGSAHYGAPVLTTSSNYLTAAAAGPASGAAWSLLLDNTGTLSELPLPGTNPSVAATGVPLDATIVFSPSGAYAVVSSSHAHTAVLISGLPNQAQVSDLALPTGTLQGVAVSDGGTVLAGLAQSTGVQISLVSGSGNALSLATVSAWGGAGFVPASATSSTGTQSSAVIADGGTGQLTLYFGLSNANPTATPLSTAGLLGKPLAVAFSTDGQWVYASDSATPQVVRVSVPGGTSPAAIPCSCQPSQLLPLAGGTAFLVSAGSTGQPAWLLDARSTAPRLFFVPALVPTASSVGPASISPGHSDGTTPLASGATR
jgi:hypothetical protein